MPRGTQAAPMRLVTITWLGGLLVIGISCRGDDLTSPLLVNTRAEGVEALASSSAGVLSIQPLSLGFAHTCGLTTEHRGYCWGRNSQGQLGDGHPIWRRPNPGAVAGTLTFVQISVNEKHSCAVTSENVAYCWGWNRDGRLGDGTLTNRSTPVRVAGALLFKQVRAGWDHTCGLTTAGKAYCWGDNTFGQIGNGTAGNTKVRPVAVRGSLFFRQVRTGRYYTCGLTAASRAFCWGYNGQAALGTGTPDDRLTPTAVAGGLDFTQLDTGPNHACALTSGNQAYCWGGNSSGQLGDGTTELRRYEPAPVVGGLQFKLIRVGGIHTCGATSEGKAYCWGYNGHGRLGDGTNTARPLPTAVEGGLTFTGLALGYHHSCGVTTDHFAYCWGFNGFGQLGEGTFIDRWTPVPIADAI
jgi:alpha-tubulin suppressor-like RCC1 family protein